MKEQDEREREEASAVYVHHQPVEFVEKKKKTLHPYLSIYLFSVLTCDFV